MVEKIKRLNKINILGKIYKIEYLEKPSDVDIFKRESLWGQIDYWTRTIRVYAHNRVETDIFETLLHEILHAIETDLHLNAFKGKQYGSHEELDILACALSDTLVRNGLIGS